MPKVQSTGRVVRTIAIHLASPTRIRPSRSPGSSGKKAHASASCNLSVQSFGDFARNGQIYHEEGGDEPVQKDAKCNLYPDFSGPENVVERLELDLAQ